MGDPRPVALPPGALQHDVAGPRATGRPGTATRRRRRPARARVRSPSVQLQVTPAGEVEIVSTHDRVLDGQSYNGGTTHPFAALEHLTGGSYDAGTATFTTPTGARRHYVATDHLQSPELRQLGTAGRRAARVRHAVSMLLEAAAPAPRRVLTAA